MVRRKFSVDGALVAIAVVLLLAARLPAEEAANPFAGKVVYIEMRSSRHLFAAMAEPRVRELAGETFLVGKRVSLNPPTDETTGVIFWMAIREIAKITEYKDLEAYRQARSISPSPP